MNRVATTPVLWGLFLFATLPPGCAPLEKAPLISGKSAAWDELPATRAFPSPPTSPLQQVSWILPEQRELSRCDLKADETAFRGVDELSVDVLVAAVLSRNPSLAQMTATWQAASWPGRRRRRG